MASRLPDVVEKEPLIFDAESPLSKELPQIWSYETNEKKYALQRGVRFFASFRGNSLRVIIDVFMFLLPSFLSSRFDSPTSDDTPKTVRPTAWLDGMRGWAAYVVFVYHTSYLFLDASQGWGFHDHNDWYRLPYIHLLTAGPVAVNIFFVVSGFALSIKPLKQMRSRAYGDLMTSLSSATLRRPIRLYGPLILSTLLVLTFGRLGAYDLTRPLLKNLTRFGESHYKPQEDGFWLDLWTWAKKMVNFCLADLYYWGDSRAALPYDVHMWTIPIEFRCSLALFTTQLALARVRVGVRLAVVLGLIICAVHQDWWAMMLFWAGMLACELHLVFATCGNAARGISLSEAAYQRPWWHRLLHYRYTIPALHIINAASALFLLSTPEVGCHLTPGFETLCMLGPATMRMRWRFWAGVGSFQLVLGAAASSTSLPLGRLSLSAIFSTPLSRYMGDISYALYCVHGLVNHLLGIPMFYAIFRVAGQENALTWGVALIVCVVLETVLVVWIADVFWRAAELPTVKLSKWFEDICLQKQ